MNFLKLVNRRLDQIRVYNKPKIFGIGNNKTGTTSLTAAMKDLGYVIGSQRPADFLLEDWAKRDFKKLVKHCRTAEFFQDFPFSKPFTYVVLDHEFPNSKFILTIRNSSEQWYNSLTRFHAKKWGENDRVPTRKDLENSVHRWKGRPWQANRFYYTSPEDNPYEKESLIKNYELYNEQVIEYFRHKPDNLLILNVAEEGAYQKLCNFLGHETIQKNFPWKNKTPEIRK